MLLWGASKQVSNPSLVTHAASWAPDAQDRLEKAASVHLPGLNKQYSDKSIKPLKNQRWRDEAYLIAKATS